MWFCVKESFRKWLLGWAFEGRGNEMKAMMPYKKLEKEWRRWRGSEHEKRHRTHQAIQLHTSSDGRHRCNILRFVIIPYYIKLICLLISANTSMDACLSMVMCNLAQVKKDDIVIDPFVGSGRFFKKNCFLSSISLHSVKNVFSVYIYIYRIFTSPLIFLLFLYVCVCVFGD